jgi:hypothetical protein
MRKQFGCSIAVLAAALLLGAAASVAYANRFEFSELLLSINFPELVLEGPGIRTLRCDVALFGSFHSRTIAKVSGSLVGDVYQANGGCEGGTLTILPATLPWHIAYISFQGALPTIRDINLQLNNGGFSAFSESKNCLYAFARANGFVFSYALEGGRVSEAITNERALIRVVRTEAGCEPERIFRGTGEVAAAPPPPTALSIRLVA